MSELVLYITLVSTIVFTFLLFALILFIYKSKLSQLRARQDYLVAVNEEKESTMEFVSMEIHDHFTQMLCLTRMLLHVIDDHAVEENKDEIMKASRYIDQLILVSHNLTNSLSPQILKNEGLIAAIENEISWINNINGVNVHSEVMGTPCQLNETQNLMIFRILQESVSNSLKHSHAKNIDVKIECGLHDFKMTIKDDGCGFDIMDIHQDVRSRGMLNLHKRSEIIGGELRIDSKKGRGTSVEFVLMKSS